MSSSAHAKTTQTQVGKPKSAEMYPGPGFRLRYGVKRPDSQVVEGFGDFATPEISDLMNRLYTISSKIKGLTGSDLTILGPACTVKVYPGDNLAVHKSLDIAQPGDIIVIDAGGSTMNAVLGDLISTKARHRGVKGFVVDGLIRDLPAIRALGDFPVFARGVTPIGPLHRGPGEVNYPISCGGIVVHSGDIIVGDLNGVVVVPQDMAGDLLQRLRLRSEAESEYTEAVARGEFSNAWVDQLLESAGVQIEEAEEHSNQADLRPD
jgi:regulator of RNase E activity RraA